MRAAGAWAAFFSSACLGLSSCDRPLAAAPSVVPADVWVTVNGHPISQREVERLSHSAHQSGGTSSQKAVLEALISQELAAQEAVKQGLSPDAAGLREIARLEEDLAGAKRRALSSALYAHEQLAADQVSPDEARRYFVDHAKDLRRQVHLLMVMRRSPAELTQMQAALASGTSFEAYAASLLPSPTPGRPQYDLGFMGWSQLPAPWREAVATLAPGQVSGVVRGEHDRYWLLELVEQKDGPELSYDEALPMVKQAIALDRGSAGRDALDAKLKAKANIVYVKPADLPPTTTAAASPE